MIDPSKHKVICMACGWHGMEDRLLSARNPFRYDKTVRGCPGCGALDCFAAACDESGCWDLVYTTQRSIIGTRCVCQRHSINE
jgi:hypothetical protein